MHAKTALARARNAATACLSLAAISCSPGSIGSGEQPGTGTPSSSAGLAAHGGSGAQAGANSVIRPPQAGNSSSASAAGSGAVGSSAGLAAIGGSGGSGGRHGSRSDAGAGAGGSAGQSQSAGAGGSRGQAGMPSAGAARATWYVQDGLLYDHCGEQVVLRGINHPTMYIDRPGDALPEIAKTGANAVRLFWYATRNIAIGEAEPAIKRSIASGMVPILEMHDSTCDWSLDGIVSYWTSSEAISLITKYQASLILNIANETSPPSDSEFLSKYSSVVQTMRTAGIHTPLMIDGGNCGRDYNVLLSQGQALLDADPDHNLIFSAHLYDPLSQAQIGKVYDDFASKKLPFIVGEFANKEPPGCGAALDYASIIGEANKRGVGWLAWSWGDNDPNTYWNSDCWEFDMASTFSFDTLERWGKEVAVTSPDSLMNSAVRPASLATGACK